MERFPASVAERLGYYVYLLRDPRDGYIFYVGKGIGNRVFEHARDARLNGEVAAPKADRIREILHSGHSVVTEILRFGLSEQTALEVEAASIELLGLTTLLNVIGGHGSLDRGRMSTDDVIALLDAQPVDIEVPAILIKPSRLWHRGMPDNELYEATRGWWKVGTRREKARYGLAVVHGVIRGAWAIERWRPRQQGDPDWQSDVAGKPRWGFAGSPAPDLAHVIGGSVSHYWKPGAQTPFIYVNC